MISSGPLDLLAVRDLVAATSARRDRELSVDVLPNHHHSLGSPCARIRLAHKIGPAVDEVLVDLDAGSWRCSAEPGATGAAVTKLSEWPSEPRAWAMPSAASFRGASLTTGPSSAAFTGSASPPGERATSMRPSLPFAAYFCSTPKTTRAFGSCGMRFVLVSRGGQLWRVSSAAQYIDGAMAGVAATRLVQTWYTRRKPVSVT